MVSKQSRMTHATIALHPRAVALEGTLGRTVTEPDDETRFPFQRDRDRILHTSAFRRLQGKTQVFASGEGDHFRTRLTHTMEVAQISRDTARALCLNEDLAECVALAHDLGHPPFGHAGEEALNAWMQEYGMHFEHNEQSHRIVTVLEKHSQRYIGLNLNREVEYGLLKHSASLPGSTEPLHHSLEAQVANLADEIAYLSHDTDDGLIGGLFSLRDITDIALVAQAWERAQSRGTYVRGSIVHLLVKDLLTEAAGVLAQADPSIYLSFSAPMQQNVRELRAFLAERMWMHPRILNKATAGKQIVDVLCRHYREHPSKKILQLSERTGADQLVAIKDYVAGMTDSFAWFEAAELGILPAEHAVQSVS